VLVLVDVVMGATDDWGKLLALDSRQGLYSNINGGTKFASKTPEIA
jgi:hypothetical protein